VKPSSKVISLALLLTFQSVSLATIAATVYDATASLLTNELSGTATNPFGPFTAGYVSDDGTFYAFSENAHTDNVGGYDQIEGWYTGVVSVLVNVSGSSFTTDPGKVWDPVITFDPSLILMHPGGLGADIWALPYYDAVVRFTAPAAGNYGVSGDWVSMHGGLTRNTIRVNSQTVFDSLEDNSSFLFNGLVLQAGDTIDFVVNEYGDIGQDSTGLRVRVINNTPSEVPIPGTLGLLGIGLAGLAFVRRKAVVKDR